MNDKNYAEQKFLAKATISISSDSGKTWTEITEETQTMKKYKELTKEDFNNRKRECKRGDLVIGYVDFTGEKNASEDDNFFTVRLGKQYLFFVATRGIFEPALKALNTKLEDLFNSLGE